MPRPLACSSKESLDNVGVSDTEKYQKPLCDVFKSNTLGNNNLTSSQISLNSNNSGKVVSFSKVVLKKNMEGKSTKIPVVVLRRSKSDVQSSKHGSRESLLTSSVERSPQRRHRVHNLERETSESVTSEADDVRMSGRSTESLHRSVFYDPDAKGFITERG